MILFLLLLVTAPKDHTLELDELNLSENQVLELPPFESIFINQLVAKDGARIRFAVQSSGTEGGVKGAMTRLFIRDLKGHLVVESRGGAGARGKDGLPGTDGKNGKKGRNAHSLFGLYIENGSDGDDGDFGDDGKDGKDGGPGGEGGDINVFYLSKEEFVSIVADVSGGDGGAGGKGGAGGIGGEGGEGGDGIRKGKKGRRGLDGLRGLDGRSGEPGTYGSASVYRLEAPLFECLARIEAQTGDELPPRSEYDRCEKLGSHMQIKRPIVTGSQIFTNVDLGNNGLVIDARGKSPAKTSTDECLRTKKRLLPSGAQAGIVSLLFSDLPELIQVDAMGGTGASGPIPGSGGDGGIIRIIYPPHFAKAEIESRLRIDVSGGKKGERWSCAGNLKDDSRDGFRGWVEFYPVADFTEWIVPEYRRSVAKAWIARQP